ncbi:MAG TPA: endonuclease, partial [Tepidisphaeraceae bacterium]|nr:endonuclease [Tepidisphaeraceae bacterium]
WLNVTSSQVTNTYTGIASDEFELRPANPTINSTRNDNWYGYGSLRGTGANTGYGNVTSGGSTYWYPGDADRGDVARSLFYMATRYGQNQATGTNLTLANGPSPTDGSRYVMGDLASLLKWNYEDGVDNFERRRNQIIYSSALNPTYYQGNRNPYIDHPEYVWSVFGGGNNDSQLYVGSSTPASGGSTANVDLGRVLVNATLGTQSVTLNKSGVDPTTYDITTSGSATTAAAGTGQPFDYNAQARTMTVGLSASTATPGVKSGSVTIDNTDLTTAGAGTGSGDGNDTVNVTATVLAHATASFTTASVNTGVTIDLGTFEQGSGTHSTPFAIANYASAAGFTAGLDLDSIAGSGDQSALGTNVTIFSALAGGSANAYSATMNTSATGSFAATYRLLGSDENLPGATGGQQLTITLSGNVVDRLPGDANFDGTVNVGDLGVLASSYASAAPGGWTDGDFNGDGIIDVSDLGILATDYGQSITIGGGSMTYGTTGGAAVAGASSNVSVPEPTSLALLALSMPAFAHRRRSRSE